MSNNKDPYKWLKAYHFGSLDFRFLEEKKKQAKEIFCLNTTILFWELCLKRLQELQDGYLTSRERKQLLNIALMERAALETFAVAVTQILNLEKLFKSEFKNTRMNLEYEERTKKLFLGMKKLEGTEKISSTNIMSHLRNIDDYLGTLGAPGLLNAYEDLSNLCHPNMPGLTGDYLTKQFVVSHNTDPDKKEFREYFQVILLLSQHFDEKIQSFKELVKQFSD